MHSRTLASLLALCLATTGASALQEEPAFSIEYPLKNYELGPEPTDQGRRASSLEYLRQRLTVLTGAQFVDSGSRLGGASSVVTGLPLGRSNRPIRILWSDPRYLFRPAVTVEWIELVDERGRVTRVWVTASNQTPRDDERIIGWCTNDALWQPSDVEGRSSAILRSAGVTLVGSPWHYSWWLEQLHTTRGKAAAIVIAALLLWLIRRVVSFRHDQRLRHEQMMARLHRTSPYKAPSIDDDLR